LVAILDKAQEVGVNFIDTAEIYTNNESERLLGAALQGRRDAFVLATKTGIAEKGTPTEAGGRLTRKRLIERLEASLKRLRTDYVDIYYFHSPDPITPLDESMRAIDDLIRAGKVRYLGISNYAGWQVAEACGIAERWGIARPAVQQGAYNLLNRAAEAEVIPACRHFEVGFVPYSPLASGFLTGKYQRGGAVPADTRFGRNPRAAAALSDGNFDKLDRYRAFAASRGRSVGELALAWLAASPAVCSIIAGATSPEQLAANARAADWALTREETAELG
jgi:aryl-alcohol dehydrogenase-like predicted oxidoreductase